jgi:hypothetical protein
VRGAGAWARTTCIEAAATRPTTAI